MAVAEQLHSAADTRRPVKCALPLMVDCAFALTGERLPHDYAFALEAALLAALPWLAEDDLSGIHPIKAPVTDAGLVLPRRARLVLRIASARVGLATALSGQRLEIGDAGLDVGAAVVRPIEPFATLRSWNVATKAGDEAGFVDEVEVGLSALGIRARHICGRAEVMSGAGRLVKGYGLAVHELSAPHSLLLQTSGLGAARRLGCGIFVHHKIIEGLGGDGE